MIGRLDLAAELHLRSRADGAELMAARAALVLASATATIRRPIDGVHTGVNASKELLAEIELARDLGFGGKACIHPKQLAPVNAGFGPSADELEWAKKVARAFEEADARSEAVISLHGQLIDRPVYLRAMSLLETGGTQ